MIHCQFLKSPVVFFSFRSIIRIKLRSSFKYMSTQSTSIKMDGIKEKFEDIKKSPNDDRFYRALILNNDMKVLLISDPTTDKSAASLDVNIGYSSDPDNLPGLAHFCEHMLFLGTEKYPNENEYNSFLSQHGGSSNASTDFEYTNYYFDVSPEHLDGALDRFSQFFLKPLFTESATELEVNAVNLEHDKNIANDSWRVDQLNKSSSNPNHPFHKFGTGNIDTLVTIPKKNGIDVRNELLKFHKNWYSSNIMTLSVLGKESLDNLEKMVVKLFANVENKNVIAPITSEHPFDEKHFAHKWYILPIKDVRTLKMVFPLADMESDYRHGSSHYISHLLGHESDGSLLSALKKAGWCNSLMAGKKKVGRCGSVFFVIAVDLTEQGLNHINDIIKLTFQYIEMLRNEGPQLWIFNELKQLSEVDFNFKDKLSPKNHVNTTVRALQLYPIEHVLTAPYLANEWQPEYINSIINYLKPENIRIHILAKAFENIVNENEYWYNTKYKKEKITDNILNQWINCGINNELKFPLKNEFIPTSFDIKSKLINKNDDNDIIDKYPTIIKDNSLMRVWFKQDDEFLIPKAYLTFDITSPLTYLDPISYNLTYIYVKLFKDSLNEYAYNATLAGLSYELNTSKYGVTLIIGGYHDKHCLLLKKILDKMINFNIDEKRFHILRENYIRHLKNFDAEQPYEHAVYYLSVLLADHVWTKTDLLESTNYITVQRLKEFIPQFLNKIHIECLIHGNLTKNEALETANFVENQLKTNNIENSKTIVPLLTEQLMLHREVNLDEGCHFLFKVHNKWHKPSCTQIYYQSGLQSTESNMHLELLAQILSEPTFSILRTKEQLGYIVFSGIRKSNGTQGLRIIVQSDRHPLYVEERVEIFLKSMMDTLEHMSQEEFARHKASLATQRLEKPKTMCILHSIFWSEISSQQYNFDRVNIEVSYLMTITKEQIIDFFKQVIHISSPSRRKLVIHVTSPECEYPGDNDIDNNHKVSVISNIQTFKSSQALYPLLKPFNDIPRKGQRSKL